MTIDDHLFRLTAIDPGTLADIHRLLDAASDADGACPLSESGLLNIGPTPQTPGATTLHLIAHPPGGPLIGYAQVSTLLSPSAVSAELVVHPAHRRRGTGRALLRSVMATSADLGGTGATLRLWSHGEHPSAAVLAADFGLAPERRLFQLRRDLADAPPEPAVPPGVTLRSFCPGRDEHPWLKVNAEAFVDLPDQGTWTMRDLRARMVTPWFDPTGFILAERTGSGELLGFHWTKIHPPTSRALAHPGTAAGLGEIYVLGVSPRAGVRGLGTTLALAGLRHLHRRGIRTAMLYVDESNDRAVNLYHRIGFGRWLSHVCFRGRTP